MAVGGDEAGRSDGTSSGRDRTPVRASAPGRVNLIGEHTDYNDGFVLPLAIRQSVHVELRRRSDDVVHARSTGSDGTGSFRLGEEVRRSDWTDYVAGVTQELAADGHRLPGFDLSVESDVPLGSGLSSSAALLVALLRGLRRMARLELDPVGIALVAQRAENGLVGASVGIMDQMACSLATTGEAIFLDCRDLSFERVPLPPGIQLAVIHTGVEHAHATGAYNARRSECERACDLLGVGSLRDLGSDDPNARADLPEPYGRRVRHVVSENERVRQAVAAIRADDAVALGVLFSASHASMRDDYEITVPEVDRLVEIAEADSRVLGARMTGGGFGGSVVVLAEPGTAGVVATDVAQTYASDTGRVPRVIEPASRPAPPPRAG